MFFLLSSSILIFCEDDGEEGGIKIKRKKSFS
jgi:hypothetical protein